MPRKTRDLDEELRAIRDRSRDAGGAERPAARPQAAPQSEWPTRKPRVFTPPQFESPARQAAAIRAIEAEGDSVAAVPESYVPAPRALAKPPPVQHMPWWQSTSGMLKVMAAVPFMLGASTASVVAIINALKQPTDPDLVRDVELARKEVAGLRTYVEQAGPARAADLDKLLDPLRSRIQEIETSLPKEKADPKRRPKP